MSAAEGADAAGASSPPEALRARLIPHPVRNVEFGGLLDLVLACAATTVVVVRFQLWVTGYPQLGGAGLHIAHLLWGGLGMIVALTLALGYLSRSSRVVAAVIGGIGFGLFIDELGKFVTADNNYFFKPTAALVYGIFVLFYLAVRWLHLRRRFTGQEKLVNAIELVKEVALHDLDEAEKQRALGLLAEADPRDPLVDPLRHTLTDARPVPEANPRLPRRIPHLVRQRYFALVRRRTFAPVLATLFVALAVVTILQWLVLGALAGLSLRGVGDITVSGGLVEDGRLRPVSLLHLIASLSFALLVLRGALRLRHSRLAAYRAFERALLLNILVVQFFALLESEFAAVFGVVFYLLLYATVRYMLSQEERLALSGAQHGPLAPSRAGRGDGVGAHAPGAPVRPG
jgi:hypothetical protein